MIPKKYKTLISGSGISKIYILFISSILLVFFEILGIGSIPIFAYLIIDTESALTRLSEFINYPISINIGRSNIILFSGLIFMSIFLIKNTFLIYIAYIQANIKKIFSQNASKKLFLYYINSPYNFFLKTNPSTLVRTINTDVSFAMKYFLAKINFLRETILIILVLSGLIIIDPLIYSITFILFFIVTIIFYFFYKRILKNKGNILLEKGAEKIKLLNQSFYSIKEIKLMSKENYFTKSFSKNVNILEGIGFISAFISPIPKIVFETLAVFAILSITVLLVLKGQSQDLIIPIVSLLAASGARFIPAFNTINASLSTIRLMQPSFDNVVKNLSSESEKINFKNDLDYQEINKKKFKEKITLENVSFAYETKEIIKNLSLEIKKGSTIGIMGQSGEGKSTLINLILGLLKPSKGQISIDGENIYNDIKSWQNNIGLIPQNIYLVDDTIKSNICFGLDEKKINIAQFKNVLKLSQLESFVDNLPDKEFSKVGDSGSGISGGQKQRIAIARALYTNPDLLILDEATSSLDLINEKNIIEEMNKYKQNKTIIIVSHRKNALKNCDKIYVLKNGEISETMDYENFDKIDNTV